MKVAFFSNFLNHHQLPFCLAMDRLTNGQFTFIATTAIPEEQLRLGYRDMNKAYPFVLTTYDSSENQSFATKLAIEADIVISGDAPEVYTKKRMEKNKITFRYSERIYKEGFYKAFHPRGIFSRLIQHTRYMRKPLYMLCASAYTSFDYALSVAYLGKTYKWGYFPEVKMQNMDELFIRKRRKKIVSILWAGRLIRWKHPEASILLAEKLKAEGFVFELDIIGSGQMEIELQEMITQKKLSDCVHMLGSMPPEAVRKHMEAADVYLFTSDFNEGWGAVLNESMNSGCAVVASHAIGSVPFLMKDGENGLIYKMEVLKICIGM